MESLRDTFLKLLSIGLWGSDSLKLAPLTESEWEIIYKFAKNHTVEGIIFDSFSFLDQGLLPPRRLLLRWTVRVDQIERHNRQMHAVIAEQTDFFQKLGVNAVLLKGQGVASCYRNPLRRFSGDIDWYIEGDGYNTVLNEIKNKKEVSYPLDSFTFEWNNVQTDCHKRLFDIFSPFKQVYLEKTVRENYNRRQNLRLNGQDITILSPELQLLQVNIHILKHLLFLGIGWRQLCDAAILYYRYHNKISPIKLKEIYKKLGVLKWMHVLHKILVEYLQLPLSYIPFPYPAGLCIQKIVREIEQSGNFGFHDVRFFETPNSTANWLRRSRKSFRGVQLHLRYAPEEILFFSIRRFTGSLSSLVRQKF